MEASDGRGDGTSELPGNIYQFISNIVQETVAIKISHVFPRPHAVQSGRLKHESIELGETQVFHVSAGL